MIQIIAVLFSERIVIFFFNNVLILDAENIIGSHMSQMGFHMEVITSLSESLLKCIIHVLLFLLIFQKHFSDEIFGNYIKSI